MAIIAHWNEWYQIEVRDWQFLEPGEAKTTIDSHHAAVSILLLITTAINFILKLHLLCKLLIQLEDMFELNMIFVKEKI